jgi:HAD superfamily hydrolase (TIGR01509 family)
MILKPPLEGLLFDFDGLILDTESTVFQAWSDKFREHGQKLLLEEWGEILGKSGEELGPIEGFLKSFGDEKIQQKIYQEVSQIELALVKQKEPLPGAVDLIRRAKAAGLKMGVVSSSDRKWVHSHLERLELLDYFDHTSCFDDVDEAKPDPSLYLLGLKKMDATPDKVIVLEDSPNGVLAAKRAGLFCIAVPNPITRQLSFFENGGTPDLVLDSLVDFPWDEFMKVNR